MSAFTDKHKNDAKLLLDTHTKTVKATLPKFWEAYEKNVNELHRQLGAYLDKDESIRTAAWRYSPEGERVERRLNARSFTEKVLKATHADTVDKLTAQLAEKRTAALKRQTPTTEPLTAILNEMRLRELRDHLRTLDPLALQARIRQAVEDGADTTLLDALEGAPSGFGIAPAALVQETRETIALKNHPELGELAQLQAAYTYALGVVEQTMLTASGLTPLEIGTEPTPEPATK